MSPSAWSQLWPLLVESAIIIASLGLLEVYLNRRDSKRRDEQQATLDSIYCELAEANERNGREVRNAERRSPTEWEVTLRIETHAGDSDAAVRNAVRKLRAATFKGLLAGKYADIEARANKTQIDSGHDDAEVSK